MNLDDIYIAIEEDLRKYDTVEFFKQNYLKGFTEESKYYEYPPFFGDTEFETDNYREMISFVLQEKGRSYRFYFENSDNKEVQKGMIFINKDGSMYLGVGVFSPFSIEYQKRLKNDFHSSLVVICNETSPPDTLNELKEVVKKNDPN